MLPATTDVLIAGGGPCGLMPRSSLGRRGIGVVLADQDPGTTRNAAANATQARTMEHFGRLGFADEVRALGLPPEFLTDAYFTRFARARASRASPCPRRATRDSLLRRCRDRGAQLEPSHRCNQKFIEPVLRRHAEALPSVSVNHGWRLAHFEQLADRVEARVESSSESQTSRPVTWSAPTARAARCARRSASRTPAKPASPKLRGRPDVRGARAHPGLLPRSAAPAGVMNVASIPIAAASCRRWTANASLPFTRSCVLTRMRIE